MLKNATLDNSTADHAEYIARRKHAARCAAIECGLSRKAKAYLRRNPALYENIQVLEALEYMDKKGK